MRVLPFASLALALTLAACGSRGSYSEMRVQPLQPQPVPPVSAQPLPPPMASPVIETGERNDLARAPDGSPAEAASAPASVEVRRPELVGGWTIASAGDNCQLFMSLTTWSGGYRANTRGCASEELKSVGAWDVAGREIVLKDANGQPMARLLASTNTRFSGQSTTGQSVQVYR
jgi:hypothetical protein